MGSNPVKVALLAAPFAALFGGVSLAQETSAPQSDAGAVASSDSGLSEIVVTAQRREQRLQDVPISISALGAEELEVHRVESVLDLAGTTPNLTISTGAGGSSLPVFQMRGLVGLGSAAGSDRGIAIYVDGVYIGSGSGSAFDFADLERVEVLRGPQGTLFGRNSTGGAISFITRNPTGEFGVQQEVTFGNYNQFQSRTRLETPQFGPVSAVINYTHSERDGDTKNSGAGTVYDFSAVNGGVFTSPERLGDQDTDAISGTVAFDFLADLDLTYRFDYSQTDSTPAAQGLLGIAPGFDTAYANLAASGGVTPTPVASHRPDAVNNGFTLPSEFQTWGHNITAQYQMTDELTVKNIIAYRETSVQVPGYQIDGFGLAPQNTPLFFINSAEGHDEQFSNETQFIWDTDFATVTAGYLYFRMDQQKGGYADGPNSANPISAPGYNMAGGIVLPTPLTAPELEGDANVHVVSQAAYAQSEFHLTPNLDVALGYRITHDEKEVEDFLIPSSPQFTRYEGRRPTYMAGVNYRPMDDLLVYAKYSTGYISGGNIYGVQFSPETAESYEVGFKADWFNRHLRTNLALFSVDYTNLQVAIAGFQLGAPAGPLPASQVLINGGDSTANGAELEVTYVIDDNWTIGSSVGYLDFEYTRRNPAIPPAIAQYRPDVTANLYATYESDPLFNDVRLVGNINGAYKSETAAAGSVATFTDVYVDPSWIVDGRIGLQGFTIGGGDAEIALWVKNLTDTDTPMNATNIQIAVSTDYTPARTYGVDLRLRF